MAFPTGLYPDYPNIIVSDTSLVFFTELNGLKIGYVEAVYAGCMEHQVTDYVVYTEGKEFKTSGGTFYFVSVKNCLSRFQLS